VVDLLKSEECCRKEVVGIRAETKIGKKEIKPAVRLRVRGTEARPCKGAKQKLKKKMGGGS